MMNFSKTKMNPAESFRKGDIIASYRWLSHKGHGYTELRAFHKDYRPGRENFEHNKKNNAFPKIWYVKTESDVMRFVQKYHKDHTVCYGFNPLSIIPRNHKGYPRGSRDEDIKTVMNFYFDIDFEKEPVNREDFLELRDLLDDIDFYLKKLKITPPVRAFTGNGYHLLFSLQPVHVKDLPDIKQKLNLFRKEIQYEFSPALKRIGAKMDNTINLSRVGKIYGTKKPHGKYCSRFLGKERVEDNVLFDYLRSLEPEERPVDTVPILDKLPESFLSLLDEDEIIQRLWEGVGKCDGDTTRTGYDFSLVIECIRKGITDFVVLATILKLRPEGAVQKSGKGDAYVRLTIANAIKQAKNIYISLY